MLLTIAMNHQEDRNNKSLKFATHLRATQEIKKSQKQENLQHNKREYLDKCFFSALDWALWWYALNLATNSVASFAALTASTCTREVLLILTICLRSELINYIITFRSFNLWYYQQSFSKLCNCQLLTGS